MKNIELTDEHKAKLLEMCKALFPEYQRIQTEEYQIDIDKTSTFVDLYKKATNVPYEICSIYWFEFTITHLWIAVFPDSQGKMFGESVIISHSKKHYDVLVHWLAGYNKFYNLELKNFHPIDYLYEHFKNIQNKK